MKKGLQSLLGFTLLIAISATLVLSCAMESGKEDNQIINASEEASKTISTGTHITIPRTNNNWDIYSSGMVSHSFSEFITVPARDKIFIGDMQTCNESDSSNVRFNTQYVNSDGNTYMWVRTKVEEDNHNGSENNHSASVSHWNREVIAGILMEKGPVRDYYSKTIGYAGSTDLDLNVPAGQEWERVSIPNNVGIKNPVLFATMATYNGSEPCHIRIKDVGVSSTGNCNFKIALEEWHRTDSAQAHTTETVNWVVLDRGSYYMGLGDRQWFYLKVDKFSLGLNYSGYSTYKTISNIGPLLGNKAVILTNIQTTQSSYPDPVVTRVKNIGNSFMLSFDVRLEEGKLEAEPQRHGVETVGYMALYSYNGD